MARKKSQQIGRYKILGELGRGAMGIVYRAEDPALDRIVALKTIILEEDVEGRMEYQKRFLQEAKAAGKLTHPHIVTTYDFGEEDGVAYTGYIKEDAMLQVSYEQMVKVADKIEGMFR